MSAAIYARKSTTQDIIDEHVYVDDGISGAEFANRPGFLRLVNALKPKRPLKNR
jgi:DNA invertase Pin-like site-specific DNA recombinase